MGKNKYKKKDQKNLQKTWRRNYSVKSNFEILQFQLRNLHWNNCFTLKKIKTAASMFFKLTQLVVFFYSVKKKGGKQRRGKKKKKMKTVQNF